MSCLDHRQDESRHFKQGRQHRHYHDNTNESYHHHHHIRIRPLDDDAINTYELPKGCGHMSHRPDLETLISEAHFRTNLSHYLRLHGTPSARAYETSGHRAMQGLKEHSKRQHALQKGVRTGAEVAYQIRNDRGSWAGEKGIKVASAAIASATIDIWLGTGSKKHPLAHAAVSAVEGIIIDGIMNGTMQL